MLVDSGKKLKIKFPQEDQDKQFNWYLYTLAFVDSTTRDKVKQKMLKHGIGATIYYDPPVHEAPYYRKVSVPSYQNGKKGLPKTESSARHVYRYLFTP